MGDYVNTYYDMLKRKNAYERAILERPGLWVCYKLTNNEIVLVDEVENKASPRPTVKDGCYCGIKIEQELGAATSLFRALQMFEHFTGQE